MALHSLHLYLIHQVEKNLRFNAALVLVTKFQLIPVRCENEIKSTRKKANKFYCRVFLTRIFVLQFFEGAQSVQIEAKLYYEVELRCTSTISQIFFS